MNFKRLLAIILTLILFTCIFVIPTNAKGNTNNNDFEIFILEDVSSETKAKIEKYFASGEPVSDEATTYGFTCTLLGHKLEGSIVCTVNHKVSATAPRCLERTYDYEACTRCDYETSELILTEYIYCCK